MMTYQRKPELLRSRLLNEAWEIISNGALDIVSRRYGLGQDIILGKSRRPRYVKARKDAILLMSSLGLSNLRIAKIFGRHHTSIMEHTNPERKEKKRLASAQRWSEQRQPIRAAGA